MLGVVLLAEPSATAKTEQNRFTLATFDVATGLHKLGEAWDFDR